MRLEEIHYWCKQMEQQPDYQKKFSMKADPNEKISTDNETSEFENGFNESEDFNRWVSDQSEQQLINDENF